MTRFLFSLLTLVACGLIGCERHPASELGTEAGEGEAIHTSAAPAAEAAPPAPAKSPEYYPTAK